MPQSFQDMVAHAHDASQVVTARQAYEAMATGDVILDVREPAELGSTGSVAGAVNIPRGLLEAQADPSSTNASEKLVGAKDASTVHVLCASGARAALAAVTLTTMGYRATVIDNGMNGWKDADLPVEMVGAGR